MLAHVYATDSLAKPAITNCFPLQKKCLWISIGFVVRKTCNQRFGGITEVDMRRWNRISSAMHINQVTGGDGWRGIISYITWCLKVPKQRRMEMMPLSNPSARFKGLRAEVEARTTEPITEYLVPLSEKWNNIFPLKMLITMYRISSSEHFL
ncbi:hypothetical protein EGR_01936 [Echinococcus granulosus]|uniref:Uncharacterized protein n=1 Tax=Echinococcus granulosus TaxID=6210 RepID=W6UX73_ECHGR|nr:hypothetical protein EGR_01936 [Echinococcus granulosus]EUB63132.1 hypothetical protein EGR_01936 [Echinococcus granulosus]